MSRVLPVESLELGVGKPELDGGEDPVTVVLMVCDSFTSSGIRERHAHASHHSRCRAASWGPNGYTSMISIPSSRS
jgi:hypothetical protein